MLTLFSQVKKLKGLGLLLLFLLLVIIVYGNMPERLTMKSVATEEKENVEVPQETRSEAISIQNTERAKEQEEPKLETTVLWAPLAGTVKQGRGWVYSSLYGEWYYHQGQDLLAQPDQLVQACLAGTVRQVSKGPNGLSIEIESDLYKIRYASLSESYVTAGQTVRQGQALGLPGQSELEPFSHVHIEVYYDKQMIEAF